ncbi:MULTISPECIES: Na(+)/H(+) antiporter subunit F1 [unclassified Sporosarcina]|uniref:Na(+)/H(+) antiporter subunit F1 n=1 Tax=unclassified Sporosarcina TaxID=2647733 RepID=UPI002040B4E8|nr:MULTISPECIES: Na(+)/H(+) antiporter subunit F1 [unclassified Sporosarcina]GKV66607.1 Na(+)/H(+) antiporter subunit F [Sporosarcina sp. NCCP-2331]GLB56943.1 Na(+)/H(+) antiporter subunit F [Sporosarcina sp. NCCP-2378]
MNIFYSVCLVLIILSMLGLLYRVWKGPSVPDRLIALDAIGVMLISAIALLSILFDTPFFIDVILLIAIMSFIGTVSFSKFIERGEIIDRGSDS